LKNRPFFEIFCGIGKCFGEPDSATIYKENGIYINYEKAIKAKGLPKEVSGAIKKRYPKSALKEIMEETEVKGKGEKLSAYEVVLETADKKEVEVRVSPKGKILEDTGAKKPEEKK